MAKQTINPGTAPTGAGGDTFRSGSAKLQANDDEIYNYLGDGTNLNKLGTAAFKNVGTGAGNLMEVGAFGLGLQSITKMSGDIAIKSGLVRISDMNSFGFEASVEQTYGIQFVVGNADKLAKYRTKNYHDRFDEWQTIYSTANTTVDGNGFIKAASPIVKLFADKIELNDEARQQKITFEKLGIGDYLVKGSLGFAQEGWYIETPKDANGNLLVAVVYEQLGNGDISVKTYDYMLNKKGRIVADTETPLDIPESRWIDLRLQELPQPEIEMPKSVTPPDFQPTGLAQAVATVMESYHDPEQ